MKFKIAFFLLSLALSCNAQQSTTPHGVKLTISTACTDTDIDQYAFYRSSVSGGPYTQVGSSTTLVAPISFLDTTVPAGTIDGKFFYVAQCHSASGGWSVPSAEVSPKGVVPNTTNGGKAPAATAIVQ